LHVRLDTRQHARLFAATTRAVEPIKLWVALALASISCGGNYWLGGRAASAGSDSSVAGASGAGAIAGSKGAPVGGTNESPMTDHVLDADVVLTGDQSFDLGADAGRACRLIGNGHSIRSKGSWLGHVSIQGCMVSALGSSSSAAISLEMSGSAQTTLANNTFDASGAIHVTNWDDSTTTFRDNVILASSVVQLDSSFDVTVPAFKAEGTSAAQKSFQGNIIDRSMCWFGSPNWLIGGDQDSDSNLIVGLRGGLVLAAGGIVVRRNYVHSLHYRGSGDEAALSVIYGTSDALAEHNVLRSGTWVIRGFGGELRYNAILDANDLAWFNQPFEGTKVHHNLFLMCHPPEAAAPSGISAGIQLVNFRATGIEIYNNTLDGGGPNMRLTGAPVTIDDACYLASLRNNVIFNVPYRRNDARAAAVRPGITESADPPPARIAYADYNLFYNPDAEQIRNYAVSVPGRVIRADSGFALHDARAGGAVDEQIAPALAAASSDCFPWADDDILSGKVTVSVMLSSLRAAYSPVRGSPVLLAGDPADGAGSAIGAVGDGTHPADRFGSF
jgi:hypothetical protein